MDNSDSGSDVFLWKGLKFHQHNLVHKIGTDAILLSAWIPKIIHAANNVLDVGTGTGILALTMADAFATAEVKAIDLDFNAIQLAKKNFAESSYGKRISLSQEDILLTPKSGHGKYELVVCNPPFYHANNPSKLNHKKTAKHSDASVMEWMRGLILHTMPNGHCCIIVPGYSTSEWIDAANALGFYNTDRVDIYSFEQDPAPVRSLLHFQNKLDKPRFAKLTLYESDKSYSAQYLQFAGISA